MASRQYMYYLERPMEPLTPCISSPSTPGSVTLSTTSFSYDSSYLSSQLTKVSFSKEVVKSSTLPLILETRSGCSGIFSNGSAREGNEVNGKYNAGELYTLQPGQTDDARKTPRDDVAIANCICCVGKNSVSPRPVNFPSALSLEIQTHMKNNAVITPNKGDNITIERSQTQSPWFSDHTPVPRREETKENRRILDDHSSHNEHTAFLCSLSAVFASIHQMDRNIEKERLIKVHTPNSTRNELFSVHPSKSIPIVFTPREDQIPIDSVNDTPDSTDRESVQCPRYGTCKISSYFIPPKIEKTKLDADLRRQTAYNSDARNNDIHPLTLSIPNIYRANKDSKIPQEIHEIKKGVAHPVAHENSPPISSLRVANHPRKKENMRYMRKNDVEFPDLATFERDQFRNYIPYPIPPFSQKDIFRGSISDKEISRKDISDSTALSNDSCALNSITPYLSPTELTHRNPVQETDKRMPDLKYSILIEIAPAKSSSQPLKSPVENETEEIINKFEDLTTWDDEEHLSPSETVSLQKHIKDDAVVALKGILNSTMLESDTHPVVISKTNEEQCELTQETDVMKRDISYSLIIEISAVASSPENSTPKPEKEENSGQHNKQASDSVREELKTCSDCFLHFPPPPFLRKEKVEVKALKEATLDISGSISHKCCSIQTSSFEQSTLNQEYSIAGRAVTETETLESTMVENSALNTIYSIYSRLPPFIDKDETFANGKLQDTNVIYSNCVKENRPRSHSLSASPPTEPEIESDSFEEQILSTFSSFFTFPEIPSDEDAMEQQSKGVIFGSNANSSTSGCVSPPCITIILSSKDNTKQTESGEPVGKFNNFKTTSASSSDSSVHVDKEENDSKDKIVPAGRKKALSPHPPVILSSPSISTPLLPRENNEYTQITGKWSLSRVNNIYIQLSCTSAPEVHTTEETDNKSKDSTLPTGRKNKLSSSPPVVPPSVSIPEININDSDYWAVAARYYSKDDNVEILYSSANDPTKERKEKKSKDKIFSPGRKNMLSPHPPVTPPLHTKQLLLESTDTGQTNGQGFISRDKFGTPFSSSPQFIYNEESGENPQMRKDPVPTTGRKMRLCPHSHGTPPPVPRSTSSEQSPREDIPKDQTMAEGHNVRENNFGIPCSYINVSPPDDSINEKQSKGRIFPTGRKKSVPPHPPLCSPSQNVTRRSPHQVSENAEENVTRDNFSSLTKSISAPDISTKDVMEEKMQESALCSHPTMTLPFKHILVTQLEGKSKENMQTNEEETISREIKQEKYPCLSLSTPNIKIRVKRKERSGKNRKLFSSPPSTSIPLDLQQQDAEELASKEGKLEHKESKEKSITVKSTTVIPQNNPTYNLAERKEKEIGCQIVDLMGSHKIVSLPVPLPIERMNGNNDEEMNSKQPATSMKPRSLPTFRPQICSIPPYRRKSETQRGNTTTTSRSQSIRQRTRSLVNISQTKNDGTHSSKQDISEVLASQKIMREEEEQIEELVYKRTFTSFDTRLSSVSTSKTIPLGSCQIKDEREHLANSYSQGSSPVTDSPTLQDKHSGSLTEVQQEKLKRRSDDKIRNIQNEDDKPDGVLKRTISTNVKYSPVSGGIGDDRSKPANKLLSTSSHSQTRDYSSLASHERQIVSKYKILVNTEKRVNSPDQEISRQLFSPHSSTLRDRKKRNNKMSTRDVSKDTEFSQQASRPPTAIDCVDADRKQDRQDDNSDFPRVKISQVPLKSLTSSRRPSPYEIAPPVLETKPRASKVQRNDSHVVFSSLMHSPPLIVPNVRPLVIRAVPPKVEPVPVSRVDLSSIPRPESSSVGPLTPPPVSVALAEAAALDDAKEVLRLLRIGVDPNSTNQLGIPVLVEAVHLGSLNAAAALLSSGTSPNARAPGGRSALHAAADVGRHHCVSLLLRHGANVNAVDKYMQTSLHLAARGGHEAAVLALMEGGADSRLQDANGDSVIQVAHNPELRRLIRRKTIERLRRKCQTPP